MATATPTSKRELSSSSTPSPIASTKQPPKKVKGQNEYSVCNSPDDARDSDSLANKVMIILREQITSTIIEQVNTSIKEMAQAAADIISASLHERMAALEFENKQLRDQIDMLTNRITHVEAVNNTFHRQLDEGEQYSRRSCLRLSGIPVTPGESTDTLVLDIAKACNVALSLSDIDRSHRVRSRRSPDVNAPMRPPDIIVKFVSYRSRSSFLKCKSELRRNSAYRGIFINEDLTRYRSELLRTARGLVRSKKIDSAWSFDGRIFIKCNNGSRRIVSSPSDLNLDNF